MSSSNCCFLTCIQVSQETGKVVWYSHLIKNFAQFVVIYTVKGFKENNDYQFKNNNSLTFLLVYNHTHTLKNVWKETVCAFLRRFVYLTISKVFDTLFSHIICRVSPKLHILNKGKKASSFQTYKELHQWNYKNLFSVIAFLPTGLGVIRKFKMTFKDVLVPCWISTNI